MMDRRKFTLCMLNRMKNDYFESIFKPWKRHILHTDIGFCKYIRVNFVQNYDEEVLVGNFVELVNYLKGEPYTKWGTRKYSKYRFWFKEGTVIRRYFFICDIIKLYKKSEQKEVTWHV